MKWQVYGDSSLVWRHCEIAEFPRDSNIYLHLHSSSFTLTCDALLLQLIAASNLLVMLKFLSYDLNIINYLIPLKRVLVITYSLLESVKYSFVIQNEKLKLTKIQM